MLKSRKKNNEFNTSVYNNILSQLQRLGKALMFPIAVLPIAALLSRFGALIQDPLANQSKGISEIQIFIGKLIGTPGQIVFDNIAIIFAIGIAFGLAKDNRGEAALVGGVVWFGMTALLKEGLLASFFWKDTLTAKMVIDDKGDTQYLSQLLYFLKQGKAVYQLDSGVIGGIVVGCVVAKLYNRYKEIQLPQALSFFGGRRFIPMLGILSIIPLGIFFAIVWPWAQYGLIKTGQFLANQNGFVKGFTVGIYAFLNRILQPFGLHHILNTFVWFQLPITGTTLAGGQPITVNGDIIAFQKGVLGSGTFTTGFFPLFLGGLPGAGLALIMTSDKDKRKQMAAFYGGATFVAWITGIDEPLIFNFIFVSPLLYLFNAIATAIFYMFVTWTHMSIGIGFSAGLIDYGVSFWTSWQMATHNGVFANPLWIWVFSIIMFITYYFVFYFVIIKFKVPTPGREKQLGIVESTTSTNEMTKPDIQPMFMKDNKTKYDILAKKILDIVGLDNIQTIENCATRLRLTVNNNSKDIINDEEIKKAGAYGVVRLGNKGYQIIIGTDVEHVTDRLKKLANK